MIQKIELIPATEESYCYASAVKVCDFESNGYEEKEYYMYGTANVYEKGEDGPRICYADAPYVNRFVVRAPRDKSRFSGNVVVEIINPTAGHEVERMWIVGAKKFMRDGDIFVGITGKPNTIPCLVDFDAERYGRLSWANPRKDMPFPCTKEEIQKKCPFPDAMDYESYETGLCWDMFTDIARLLREKSDRNPIADYGDCILVLAGWSQCVGYIRQYVKSFAERMEENIYDGYFCAGGVPSCYIPLNISEWCEKADTSEWWINKCRVPFMVLQTESDANARLGYFAKKEDSDLPDFKYRLYEFAGVGHDTESVLVDYYLQDAKVQRVCKKIKLPPVYDGHHEHPIDYPYEYLYAAAYRNMFYWIRTGVAPAPCERIKIDSDGRCLRDGFGNSIGGVRTCFVDYPIAHYCSGDRIGLNNEPFTRNSQTEFSGFGYKEPFTPEMLKVMYGTLDNYRALCEENTQMQVSKGMILREDAKEFVELAVERARACGLT